MITQDATSKIVLTPERIPAELRSAHQWVLWRFEERKGDNKPTKVPWRADGRHRASSTDPATWSDFETTLRAYISGRWDGMGYVFDPSTGIVGIDLDHCRDTTTGKIESWAQAIIDRLRSYTEVSPSGSGIHIITRASLPSGGNKKAIKGANHPEAAIELYASGRYFSVTGQQLPNTSDRIEERSSELERLHAELFAPPPAPTQRRTSRPPTLEDSELLEKARGAKNGADFSRLFDGDISAYSGDDSKADLALCCHLAFWTSKDFDRMDRLFRQSALYREKWDSRRGDSTYGALTIQKAITATQDAFTPGKHTSRTNGHSSSPVPTPGPNTGGAADAEEPLTAFTFSLTEAGNAELFAYIYGHTVRFDHRRKRDLIWKGHWWADDSDGELVRIALEAMRLRKKLAGDIEDPDKSKQAFNWAVGSESRSRLMNAIEIARHLRPIADEGKDWDADPFLLGTGNGVVDLRTGQLRPGRQADRLTMHTPVDFMPEAGCPVWTATLERILPDIEVRAFFKRIAGYGITGSVREQCLPFLFGSGRNGKSTVLKAILDAVGDYGRQAAPDLLTYSKESRHPTEIADLYGARFVASVEVEEGKRLAEVLVKQMTGGDRLKGRKMKQDFFEFTPTHKVFLAANHKPVIRGTDTAIWRRMLLIPFTVTIPEDEVDPDLPDKLHAEREGILTWLVEGCLEWQRIGLKPPIAVKAATSDYKHEMDILAAFMADCCVVNPSMKVGATPLYKAYREWCEANGERFERNNDFSRRLTEKGYYTRRSGARGTMEWYGLGLVTDPQQPLSTEATEATEPNWGITAESDSLTRLTPQTASVTSVTSVTYQSGIPDLEMEEGIIGDMGDQDATGLSRGAEGDCYYDALEEDAD